MDDITTPQQPNTPITPVMPENQPVSPMPQPGQPITPKKSKKAMWIWLIVILLLLGGGASAAVWYMGKNKKPAQRATTTQTSTETKAAIECDEGFTKYENTDEKFGFCYPESWGEVSVKKEEGTDYDQDESGGLVITEPIKKKGYILTGSFSKKAAINFFVLSKDHERQQLGGGGALQDVYGTFVSGYKKDSDKFILTQGDNPKEITLKSSEFPKEFTDGAKPFLVYSDAAEAQANAISMGEEDYGFFMPQLFTITNLNNPNYPGILFRKQLTNFDSEADSASGTSTTYQKAIEETKVLNYTAEKAWADPDLIAVAQTINDL